MTDTQMILKLEKEIYKCLEAFDPDETLDASIVVRAVLSFLAKIIGNQDDVNGLLGLSIKTLCIGVSEIQYNLKLNEAE